VRASILVLGVASALVFVASAVAKGPDYALISGPGISGSIRIDGEEGRTGTPLGALVAYGGFSGQVFGRDPNQVTTTKRPDGTLGARYRVVYSVPAPGARRSIRADLYPFAAPQPLTYMQPGQPFLPALSTHGGWYVAPVALRGALVRAGLPDAPAAGGAHVWRWLGLAVLGLAIFAVALGLWRRRVSPAVVPAP
jgi:hypothetical protein